MKKKLAFASLAIAMPLLVLEIYIRVTKEHVTPGTLHDRSLHFLAKSISRHAMKPSAPGSGHINALGLKAGELPVAKPAGEVRVLILGGSSVFDIEAEAGRDWPALVQEKLSDLGRTKVRVINGGVPGHASWDCVGRLYADHWQLTPDVVALYTGWNDIKYLRKLSRGGRLIDAAVPMPFIETGEVWNPYTQYTGPIDWLLCRSQLFVRARSRYWTWRTGRIGLEGAAALEQAGKFDDDFDASAIRQLELIVQVFCDTSRNIGAIPVVFTEARLIAPQNTREEKSRIAYQFSGLSHDGLLRAYRELDEVLRRVAAAKGAPFLDLSAAHSGHGALFIDHVHTTAEGSAALGSDVAQFLHERVLDQLPATASPR